MNLLLYWLLMPAGSVTQQLHQAYHPPPPNTYTGTNTPCSPEASCANIDFLKHKLLTKEKKTQWEVCMPHKIINLSHGKDHRLHKRHERRWNKALPVDRWCSPGCWITPLKWKTEHSSQSNDSSSFCMSPFYTVIINFLESRLNYLTCFPINLP